MKDIFYYASDGTITEVETPGREYIDAARYGFKGDLNLSFQNARKALGDMLDAFLTSVPRASEDQAVDELAASRKKPYLLVERSTLPEGKPEDWHVVDGKIVANG